MDIATAFIFPPKAMVHRPMHTNSALGIVRVRACCYQVGLFAC